MGPGPLPAPCPDQCHAAAHKQHYADRLERKGFTQNSLPINVCADQVKGKLADHGGHCQDSSEKDLP